MAAYKDGKGVEEEAPVHRIGAGMQNLYFWKFTGHSVNSSTCRTARTICSSWVGHTFCRAALWWETPHLVAKCAWFASMGPSCSSNGIWNWNVWVDTVIAAVTRHRFGTESCRTFEVGCARNVCTWICNFATNLEKHLIFQVVVQSHNPVTSLNCTQVFVGFHLLLCFHILLFLTRESVMNLNVFLLFFGNTCCYIRCCAKFQCARQCQTTHDKFKLHCVNN